MLPVPTRTTPARVPGERITISAIAGAILIWTVYTFTEVIDLDIARFALGAAVSGTVSAVVIACWYAQRRTVADEHNALCAETREQHAAVLAELQRLTDGQQKILTSLDAQHSAYDWTAYADGVRDAMTRNETNEATMPTPIRRGIHTIK